MNKFAALVVSASAALLALPAQAVILQYTISGIDTAAAGQIEFASFQIDSDRLPDAVAPGIGLAYAAVPGTFTYGSTTTTDPQDISFYLDLAHGYDDPTTNPGGLYVGDGSLLGYNGPQLFDGPIDHPTLLTGDFTLTDDFSGSQIALHVAAVPEPATWMMMVVAFGMLGTVLRRKGLASAFAASSARQR